MSCSRRLPPINKGSAAKKQPAKNTTADIKMCFFDIKGETNVSKLDDDSLAKLTEAAQSALSKAAKRGSNMYGFVVVNPSKIFGQDEAAKLANCLTSMGARIVSSAASTLVVESVEGYTVTIVIIGGAQFEPIKVNQKFEMDDGDDDDDNYASDSSSSFEDASNQQMTQECNLRRYKK